MRHMLQLCCCALVFFPVASQYQVDSDGKHWKVNKNEEYTFPAGEKPPTPKASTEPTLFLGISGYRDSERCSKTIFYAFTEAKWPEKLTVGVVEQVASNDPHCVDMYCKYIAKMRPDLVKKLGTDCPYKSQIKIKRVDYSESKGPVYARAMQGALIGDQEFCMQVDSHAMFKKNYDELQLADWYRTENENAVLTTYVHDIGALGQGWAERVVPHVCKTQWGAWGTVRNSQAANIDFGSESATARKPVLSITWAAGYSYSKCHFEKNVPYDINLKEVFDGEEFSRFARGWTRGYDTYTPSNNYVFHDYFKKMGKSDKAVWNYDPPKIDPTVRAAEEAASSKRLAALFHMSDDPNPEEPYGLGDARDFEALVKYTGIEFRSTNGHIKKPSRGERCNTMHWVPYDKSKAPGKDSARAKMLGAGEVHDASGGDAKNGMIGASGATGGASAAAGLMGGVLQKKHHRKKRKGGMHLRGM